MTGSQIYAQTEEHLQMEKALVPPAEMRQRAAEYTRVPLDFRASLLSRRPGIIAPIVEIGDNPEQVGRSAAERGKEYVSKGAVCLAVDARLLYFNQLEMFMGVLRDRTDIPILQCLYTIDNYQVYESLLLGADAVMIPGGLLGEEAEFLLVQCAHECGLQAVTLVHDSTEARSAARTGTDMIAAGNVIPEGMDLTITQQVLECVPKAITGLSFGGIKSHADVERAVSYGAAGMLVAPEFFC